MAKKFPSKRITAQAGSGLTADRANQYWAAAPDTSVASALGPEGNQDENATAGLPAYDLLAATADLNLKIGSFGQLEKGKASIEMGDFLVRSVAAYVAADNGLSIVSSGTLGVVKKATAGTNETQIMGGGTRTVTNADGTTASATLYRVVRL